MGHTRDLGALERQSQRWYLEHPRRLILNEFDTFWGKAVDTGVYCLKVWMELKDSQRLIHNQKFLLEKMFTARKFDSEKGAEETNTLA